MHVYVYAYLHVCRHICVWACLHVFVCIFEGKWYGRTYVILKQKGKCCGRKNGNSCECQNSIQIYSFTFPDKVSELTSKHPKENPLVPSS